MCFYSKFEFNFYFSLKKYIKSTNMLHLYLKSITEGNSNMSQTNAMRKTLRLKPEDLGSLRNALGILSEDRKKLRPDRLLSVTGLGRTELSRITKKSRPLLYERELPLKLSSAFTKEIYSLVIVTDLAFELFAENEENTKSWLMAPNTLLFGDSPFVVSLRGEGDQLIEWLNQRLRRSHSESHK
jgi:uncharacterized protein (DUF2384 family)